MVDWDRVEELRSKGVGWEKIAADTKVGFHADASAGDPGRALRALYHRNRSRIRARPTPSKRENGPADRAGARPRWTPLRAFYLLVPLVGIWAAFAYAFPSPVGLVVPAFPWLALALAVVAAVLIWLVWRASGPRWSTGFRTAVIVGVVLGLVVSALIGLTGSLVYGCPVLPPSSSLSPLGNSGWTAGSSQIVPWSKIPTAAWQSGGLPVFYSYGSTWCPFCSASSWAEWKALGAFGTVNGASFGYSSATDVYPRTPEVVLAGITLSVKNGFQPAIAWQVSEDTSGVQSTFPGTASCTQQAYLTSYGGGIPYTVVNGQYTHDGSLALPQNLSTWAGGANGGASTVANQVLTESGPAWSSISFEAYWLMAFLAKSTGLPVTTLANWYLWTTADQTAVSNDLNLM